MRRAVVLLWVCFAALGVLGITGAGNASTSSGAGFLTETQWLADNLKRPDLVIVETTYMLKYDARGRAGLVSGKAEWASSHIPGSIFIDLRTELSDTETTLDFMMPPASQMAAVMSKYGIDDQTHVVIYDRTSTTWATRLWWMLRTSGFDRATVLNGGFQKWVAENRPTTNTPMAVTRQAQFVVRPRPALFVGKAEVVAAMESKRPKLICSLDHAQFIRGYIPGSINIAYSSFLDPDNHPAFLPIDQLYANFQQHGVVKNDRVIFWCGSGISATLNAFVAAMLGFENVAVYDGSLGEWWRDGMPLVTPSR